MEYWDAADLSRAAAVGNTVALAYVAARIGQEKTKRQVCILNFLMLDEEAQAKKLKCKA